MSKPFETVLHVYDDLTYHFATFCRREMAGICEARVVRVREIEPPEEFFAHRVGSGPRHWIACHAFNCGENHKLFREVLP